MRSFSFRLREGSALSRLLTPFIACVVMLAFATASRGDQIYESNSNGTVGEYSTSGATISASLDTVVGNLQGIAISGSDVFVSNNTTGTISEYSTSGTLINASLITGLHGPDGMVVSGSDLFVANFNSGVIGEYTTSGAVVNAFLISGLTVDGPRELASVRIRSICVDLFQ